ncbi:MAG: hypothetical protein J6B01_04455 [Ruminococcus sp.]|nr:hypothetical protein [Ruminococcus sp.]
MGLESEEEMGLLYDLYKIMRQPLKVRQGNGNREMTNLYDIYEGGDLKIAQKIQQRRLQIMVHSYLYYVKDVNIITDATWSRWAKELVELQEKYPDIAKQVIYSEEFKDFDGSSGAFFTYDDYVINRAEILYADSR